MTHKVYVDGVRRRIAKSMLWTGHIMLFFKITLGIYGWDYLLYLSFIVVGWIILFKIEKKEMILTDEEYVRHLLFS